MGKMWGKLMPGMACVPAATQVMHGIVLTEREYIKFL